MNSWEIFIIIYLISSVIFNHSYKITTKYMLNDASITILIQILSSLFCILLIPLFEIKFPKDFKVYIFLGISMIFYAINDRLGTTARSGIDASSYSVIKQFSNVLMIFLGIIFFKENIILNKIIGAILIIFSNILILYQKGKFKINKYIILAFVASISLTIALLIDVNYSNEFNLAIYVLLIMLFPAILILVFERIKIKDLTLEYKNSNKISLYLTSLSWMVVMLSKLKAYSNGLVTIVAPLTSLTVILTVVSSYFILNEKDNLFKKIISSILIIVGVIFIKYF